MPLCTSITRHKEWRPIFGQVGASQGHLRNKGIGPGDLFLFFGLFQEVTVDNNKIKLNRKSSPKHIIWGWFQIETSVIVDEIDQTQFEWAIYHPHFYRKPDKSNTIYFAKRTLDIPKLEEKTIGGAGIFSQSSNKLQLTAPESSVSKWILPLWMFPSDEALALSYHGNLGRWEKHNGYTLLQTVGRGQEFVLNCLHYPESVQWVNSLFK